MSQESLKNNKSLEICCEDYSIHLPTKVEKILRSSEDHKENRIRGALFVKKNETDIVLNTFLIQKYICDTFSNLFDFQTL